VSLGDDFILALGRPVICNCPHSFTGTDTSDKKKLTSNNDKSEEKSI
jgi:hypothetical protein